MTKLEREVAEKYLEFRVRCYNLARMLGTAVIIELESEGSIYRDGPMGDVFQLTGKTLKKYGNIAL